MYTLQSEFGLTERVAGSGSVVFTTVNWDAQFNKLKNLSAQAKVLALIRDDLANYRYVPGEQPPGWLKGPLGHTNGVFELKTEGARPYGRFIGYDGDNRSIFVFDTIEYKPKDAKTNTKLAKQAADTIQAMVERWPAIVTASKAASAGPIDLDRWRKKRKG